MENSQALIARPPQLAVARRVGRVPPIIDAGSRWRRSLTLTGPSDTATNCRFKRPSREALDQMRQADRDAWSASEHRLGDRDRELWESNSLLLYELRRQGQDELADDLAQYHTERLAAAQAEAEQKQQETAGQAPAGEFSQQADLHIPPPTYKGKAAINFKVWRDTMLAAVRAAPSDEDLGRRERDKASDLQRFEVAMKPAMQEIQVAVQTVAASCRLAGRHDTRRVDRGVADRLWRSDQP
jgi:hypothetical protein